VLLSKTNKEKMDGSELRLAKGRMEGTCPLLWVSELKVSTGNSMCVALLGTPRKHREYEHIPPFFELSKLYFSQAM
jgi:hypothetical protein